MSFSPEPTGPEKLFTPDDVEFLKGLNERLAEPEPNRSEDPYPLESCVWPPSTENSPEVNHASATDVIETVPELYRLLSAICERERRVPIGNRLVKNGLLTEYLYGLVADMKNPDTVDYIMPDGDSGTDEGLSQMLEKYRVALKAGFEEKYEDAAKSVCDLFNSVLDDDFDINRYGRGLGFSYTQIYEVIGAATGVRVLANLCSLNSSQLVEARIGIQRATIEYAERRSLEEWPLEGLLPIPTVAGDRSSIVSQTGGEISSEIRAETTEVDVSSLGFFRNMAELLLPHIKRTVARDASAYADREDRAWNQINGSEQCRDAGIALESALEELELYELSSGQGVDIRDEEEQLKLRRYLGEKTISEDPNAIPRGEMVVDILSRMARLPDDTLEALHKILKPMQAYDERMTRDILTMFVIDTSRLSMENRIAGLLGRITRQNRNW